MQHEHTGHAIDAADSLTDPATLAQTDAVEYSEETETHETRDHWEQASDGIAGRAVVGAVNDAGETLVLIHDEYGVALLPYGPVDPGGDWNTVAHEQTEGKTGIEVETEAVLGVAAVDHVVEGKPSLIDSTTRVVFRARPVGGSIQPCKQAAENGSDGWRAEWVAEIPDHVSPPSDGPQHDFDLVMD